jgi:hypothetical protein
MFSEMWIMRVRGTKHIILSPAHEALSPNLCLKSLTRIHLREYYSPCIIRPALHLSSALEREHPWLEVKTLVRSVLRSRYPPD